MNNNERKDKILKAIEVAQKNGFTLVYGEWGGADTKCACALTCLFLSEGVDPNADDQDEPRTAARILNVSEPWINSFLDGFDGNGQEKSAAVPEAWKLGSEIRIQSKPIDYMDFVEQMDK